MKPRFIVKTGHLEIATPSPACASRRPAERRYAAGRRHPLAMLLVGALVLAAGERAAAEPGSTDQLTVKTSVTIDGQQMYELGFDKLAAFEYVIYDEASGATPEEIAAAKETSQIPEWIREYDAQRVALTGYMLPLKVEDGLASKFIMMRDVNTCCYGNVPNMNEYVVVSMTTGGVQAVQDIPVVLIGTLKILEIYEGGFLTSIFQMDGEKFLGPKK